MLAEGLITGSYLYVPSLPTLTPVPARPTATICRPPYGWVTYLVRPGDTLGRVAALVGMTPASLAAANCLGSSNIYSGQTLAVPYLPAPIYPTATYSTWPTPTFIWFPTLTRTWTETPQPTWPATWTPGITIFPTNTQAPTIAPTHGWTQMPPTSEAPPPTTEPPPSTTEAPPPTTEPTSIPSLPPPPTLEPPTPQPVVTQLSEPTQAVPTQPPAPTEIPPTQLPVPTQVPPTNPPATQVPVPLIPPPTQPPIPTSVPPTQPPAPTAAPPTLLPPTSEAPIGWFLFPTRICTLVS